MRTRRQAELAPVDLDAVARCLAPEGAIAARPARLRSAPRTGASWPSSWRTRSITAASSWSRRAPARARAWRTCCRRRCARSAIAARGRLDGDDHVCRTSCSSTTCRSSKPGWRLRRGAARDGAQGPRQLPVPAPLADAAAGGRPLGCRSHAAHQDAVLAAAHGDGRSRRAAPVARPRKRPGSAERGRRGVHADCAAPYHRIGVCFLARARRAAEDSHIVIANHALLLSDLVSRSRVLPDYDVLIVDEAHHLEDEADPAAGLAPGRTRAAESARALVEPRPGHGGGAIPEALALIRAGQPARGCPPSCGRRWNAANEPSRNLVRLSRGCSRGCCACSKTQICC